MTQEEFDQYLALKDKLWQYRSGNGGYYVAGIDLNRDMKQPEMLEMCPSHEVAQDLYHEMKKYPQFKSLFTGKFG